MAVSVFQRGVELLRGRPSFDIRGVAGSIARQRAFERGEYLPGTGYVASRAGLRVSEGAAAFAREPVSAAEARAVRERTAEVARQEAERRSVEERTVGVEGKVFALREEASAIESQRAVLESQQAEIRRVEKSMVQRGSPYHRQLVSEYNRGVAVLSGKVSEHNLRQQVVSLEVSEINREIRRVELDRPGVEFVRERFAEMEPRKEVAVKPTPPERLKPTIPSYGLYIGEAVSEPFRMPHPSEEFAKVVGLPTILGAPARFMPERMAVAAGRGLFATGGFVGGVLTKEVIGEAERVKGREFPYKPYFVAAGEMAGEWAWLSAIVAAPKAVEMFPKPAVRLYKTRLERLFVGKPKEVFYPEMAEPVYYAERAKLGFKLPSRLGPEFARAVVAPKPKARITSKAWKTILGIEELPKVKPVVVTPRAKEFIYGIKEPTVKTFYRQFAPRELTVAEKAALPELKGYIAPRAVQIVKPKVRVEPYYKEWPPAYFESFERAVAAPPPTVAFAPPKPVTVKKFEFPRIPGAYVTLARGLPKAVKPIVELPKAELKMFEEYREAGLAVHREFVQYAVIPKPRLGYYLEAPAITRPAVSLREVEKQQQRMVESARLQVAEAVSPAVRVAQVTVPVVRERMAMKEMEKMVARQVQVPRMVRVPKFRFPEAFAVPFVPLLAPPVFRKPRPKPLVAVPGFFPITRRAGEEIFLTKMPVSKEAARAIAIAEVVGSPRASFKILKAAAPAVKVAYPRLPFSVERMFRPAKTLPGFLVEKMKYRIDMPQELKKITYAGLAKLAKFPELRKKRKKRGNVGWF